MRAALGVLASLVPLAMLLGCGAEPDQIVYGIQAHSFANSEWSTPVLVNVNSPPRRISVLT